MKRTLLLVALVGILSGMPAVGLDHRDARQTAGIYLSIDGRMHSVFGDFSALRFIEGEIQSVPFALNSDLDLWIEGRKVSAGKKDWTFEVDKEGVWTLGERASAGGEPVRFRVPHRESPFSVPCLTSSFHLDSGGKTVVVRFSFGKHAGELLLGLEHVKQRTGASVSSLDMVRGRQELSRLREIVGRLRTEQAKRPAWSAILSDLGESMLKAGDAHLQLLTFEQGEEGVGMTINGQAEGGQDAADTIAAALRTGNAPRIFSEVSRPVARLAEGGQTWNFEISATAPASKWNASAKVDPLSDGQDPASLALELLLLEAHLRELTAASPLGIADIQPRLLSAKRRSGAMLSRIAPGSRKEDHGLVRFPIRLRVTGSGASVITFIRSLEESRAPMTIIPERITSGIRMCDAELTLLFYDYENLAKRLPALDAAIRPVTLKPGFNAKVDFYLQGLDGKPLSPFVPPAWPRDPFSVPGE